MSDGVYQNRIQSHLMCVCVCIFGQRHRLMMQADLTKLGSIGKKCPMNNFFPGTMEEYVGYFFFFQKDSIERTNLRFQKMKIHGKCSNIVNAIIFKSFL